MLLVGADTGRDGIHGASFASVVLDATALHAVPRSRWATRFSRSASWRHAWSSPATRVIAMQDLGAAGLCGSAAELAHRGGCGIEVDVARASRRETGMTPYEVMLSESQERMLIVARPGDVRSLQQVFERWDLHSDVVGVILRATLRGSRRTEQVCDLPLDLLVDGAPPRGAPGRARTAGPVATRCPAPTWTPAEASSAPAAARTWAAGAASTAATTTRSATRP